MFAIVYYEPFREVVRLSDPLPRSSLNYLVSSRCVLPNMNSASLLSHWGWTAV